MTIGTPARARVHVAGTPQRLDAAEEHHLLRIGLEALTNALKHASPSRIDIYLHFEPDGTTSLEVHDNGCGLPMPGTLCGRREHFGLQGIRERVVKLGGTLQIDSQPGKGTRLAVTMRSSGQTDCRVHREKGQGQRARANRARQKRTGRRATRAARALKMTWARPSESCSWTTTIWSAWVWRASSRSNGT
jgi:hypothetical protein